MRLVTTLTLGVARAILPAREARLPPPERYAAKGGTPVKADLLGVIDLTVMVEKDSARPEDGPDGPNRGGPSDEREPHGEPAWANAPSALKIRLGPPTQSSPLW